jgi:hypothetical protein
MAKAPLRGFLFLFGSIPTAQWLQAVPASEGADRGAEMTDLSMRGLLNEHWTESHQRRQQQARSQDGGQRRAQSGIAGYFPETAGQPASGRHCLRAKNRLAVRKNLQRDENERHVGRSTDRARGPEDPRHWVEFKAIPSGNRSASTMDDTIVWTMAWRAHP